MDKPEGRIWGLSAVAGCAECSLSGEGIVISVPKYVENRVGKICYGDMVSWKGLWHRVKAVIDDERCENVRVSLI